MTDNIIPLRPGLLNLPPCTVMHCAKCGLKEGWRWVSRDWGCSECATVDDLSMRLVESAQKLDAASEALKKCGAISEEMPHAKVVDLALSMYTGEPCRICRRDIAEADVRDAVFSGYCEVDGRTSRASHGQCWRDLSDEAKAKP